MEKMPFKATLGNLEWKIFSFTQPWWAKFKITFAVITIRKTHESFFKKLNRTPSKQNNQKQFVLITSLLQLKELVTLWK